MQLQTHEVVEVCAKILYQVELNRGGLDIMWGFSVEAELVENSEVKQDELQCYVSRVEDRSVAINNGETLLQPGLFPPTFLVRKAVARWRFMHESMDLLVKNRLCD